MTIAVARYGAKRLRPGVDQPRDAHGRWIEIGQSARFRLPGSASTGQGQVVGFDAHTVRVRTGHGWVVDVPAGNLTTTTGSPYTPGGPQGVSTHTTLLSPEARAVAERLTDPSTRGGFVRRLRDGVTGDVHDPVAELRNAQTRGGATAADNQAVRWHDEATEWAKQDPAYQQVAARVRTAKDPLARAQQLSPGMGIEARAAMLQAARAEMRRRAGQPAGMRDGRGKDSSLQVATAMARAMPDGMTDDEIAGIRYYQGRNSINTHIHNDQLDTDLATDADRNAVNQLESALSKSVTPEAALAVRGGGFRPLFDLGIGGTHATDAINALPGTVINYSGFLSTSLADIPPSSFGHESVQWLIRVPAGTPGLYLGRKEFDPQYAGEKELLLGRGQRLLVHAAYPGESNPRTLFIEAELLPAGAGPPREWSPDPYLDADAGYPEPAFGRRGEEIW